MRSTVHLAVQSFGGGFGVQLLVFASLCVKLREGAVGIKGEDFALFGDIAFGERTDLCVHRVFDR